MHRHQDLGDFVLDVIDQLTEQLKRFTLVFLLGLLLGVATQMDALAQIVQCAQVVTPVGVKALQQHCTLELREVLTPHLCHLGFKSGMRQLDNMLQNFLVGDGLGLAHPRLQLNGNLPFVVEDFLQRSQVPLLFHRLGRYILAHQICHAVLAHRGNHVRQIRRIEDVVALLVDHLALVIGYVVVFQQLLADVEIAGLDLALGRFNAARHDAGFDGFAIGHLQAVHDGLDAIARENAHQRVIQAQVET